MIAYLNKKGNIFVFLVKPVIFICAVTLFFLFYNAFLIDKSIKTLQFALDNVALAETIGPVPYSGITMQVQLVDGLSSKQLDIETVMGLSYASNTLNTFMPERNTGDMVSVTQLLITKKQNQRHFILRIIDSFIEKIRTYYRNIFSTGEKPIFDDSGIDLALLADAGIYEDQGNLAKALEIYNNLILEYSGSVHAPSIMLRLAYIYQKLGNTRESEKIYRNILSRFPGLPEAQSAAFLIAKIKDANKIDGKISRMERTLINAQGVERQEIYYELGLLNLSAFRLDYAKANFEKAINEIPDNKIAQEAYLRIGICEKILGNYNASKLAFSKLSSLFPGSEIGILVEYQSAEIYRKEGNYERLAEKLKDVSENAGESIKPMLLFFTGSTYLFDMKDSINAKNVFEKLREEFPALSLVYPGTDFVDKHVGLDVPPKLPDEVADLFNRTWLEAILPQRLLTLTEQAALKFVTRVTEGVREIVLLEEYDIQQGNFATIDLTERRLNNYLKKWFPVGNSLRVWDVSMAFKGGQKLDVKATIYLPNNIKIHGFIQGEFKIIKMHSYGYLESEGGQENYCIYIPSRFTVLNIPLPKVITNIVLKPSIQQFNRKFPLHIEEFVLDKHNIVFAGPVREGLMIEMVAEAYGLRHMEKKAEDSGFIYGRRR